MKKILLLFTLLYTQVNAQISLKYTLSMPEPHTHYFEVLMEIKGIKEKSVDIKMPVWAPGSYLVREFARNVEAVEAKSTKGSVLKAEKINKNTWRVEANPDMIFSYKVYANELSVRTSFVNDAHAFVSGSSVFMYIDKQKQLPCTLEIKPFKDWKKINTSLIPSGTNIYTAPDYDILVDSPIEIGNQVTFDFMAAGVKHTVAMFGDGNYIIDTLKKDMARVVEACTQVVGENPNTGYTFIIHNLTNPSGGLEHLSSTTLEVNRFTYQPKASYVGFLTLVAHEYFHLWNVKRIRPIALGPFDYNTENYTNMLWLSEGVTSYYEEHLMQKIGFKKPNEYVDYLTSTITSIEAQPGNKIQAASESSFDAWIKGYRPNENSYNNTISYYGKGEVIGMLLDLQIINATGGQKSLDDLMKHLYNEFYKKQKRGFTDAEFKQAAEALCGKKLDDFFKNVIYGVQTPDYATILGYAGITLTKAQNEKAKATWGANASDNAGKLIVKSVVRGTSAYNGGINAEDEIISVDDYRVNNDKLTKYLLLKKPGDKIKVMVSRDDIIKNLEITLLPNESTQYVLAIQANMNETQKKVFNKWMYINN